MQVEVDVGGDDLVEDHGAAADGAFDVARDLTEKTSGGGIQQWHVFFSSVDVGTGWIAGESILSQMVSGRTGCAGRTDDIAAVSRLKRRQGHKRRHRMGIQTTASYVKSIAEKQT